MLNTPRNPAAGRALDSVFSALADPTRRGILERLGDGDATVSELAEPFSISLPAISRHLKVLETAGLIARGRRAQWRTNSLRTAPLDEAGDWMEHLRVLWDGRLDRLEAHIRELRHLSGHTPETSTSAGATR